MVLKLDSSIMSADNTVCGNHVLYDGEHDKKYIVSIKYPQKYTAPQHFYLNEMECT